MGDPLVAIAMGRKLGAGAMAAKPAA